MIDIILCIVLSFSLVHCLGKLAITEIMGFERFKEYKKNQNIEQNMLRKTFYSAKTVYQIRWTILTAICVYLLVNYFWVESITIIANGLIFGILQMKRLQKAEELSLLGFTIDLGSLIVFIVAAMYSFVTYTIATAVILVLFIIKNIIECKGAVKT